MKQQTTERGRIVLNEGMDIHAGSAICIGYNNFMEKFYKAAPIGITVEGSNTLTRSLIIFGQGLNKSHPYIYPILESILNNNVHDFKKHFDTMFVNVLNLYFQSFCTFTTNLENQIINFATLTNFVALKGGLIKKEQMLSGDMSDIFSNIYLALAVEYYEKENKISKKLTNYIIKRLLLENQIIINRVINNLGVEKIFLMHLIRKPEQIRYEEVRTVFNEIMENPNIINEIKKNIHIGNNILEDLENIHQKDLENVYPLLFNKLKDKIINVDEYII